MSNLVSVQSMTELEVKNLVAAFLGGRKKTTIEAYKRDLTEFSSFIGSSSVEDAAKKILSLSLGQANMLAMQYKAFLVDKLRLQSATVNRRLSALRSFIKLARVLGFVNWDLEIENQKNQAFRDVKGIGVEGMGAIFNFLAEKKDIKSVRDYAILRLLFDLALRREEVCQIQMADIDLTSSTVAILGKGQNQKENLSLPEHTTSAIAGWLIFRGNEPGALFHRLDKGGKESKSRLTGVGLYTIVKELGKKVGIRKMTVHKIRHTSITACCEIIAENNLGIESLTKFSRHRSLDTALVYLDNLEGKQKKLSDLVSKKIRGG